MCVAIATGCTIDVRDADGGAPTPDPTNAITFPAPTFLESQPTPSWATTLDDDDDLRQSFSVMAAASGASLGFAAAPVGAGTEVVLGNVDSGPAWSTIKVPLVMAAHYGPSPDVTDEYGAITTSDNAAAERLWENLGTPEEASAAVEAILAAGGGVGPALAAGAVGVGVAWLVAARVTSGPATARSRVGTAGRSVGAGPRGDGAVLASPGVAAVLAAGQVQLVMMALTSVDLLLARALLTPEDAGRYALGAVAAKAAFWLPQAVGTVLYPRMADPAGHRGAVRSAVTVLLGIGAVVVIGAAVAAPLVPVVVGEDYRPVAGLLWAFALLGVTLSVLQAFLLAIIASDRTVEAGIAWCGLVLTAIAVWSAPRDVEGVLAAALVAVVLTTVTAGWRALRSRPA